MTAQVLVTQDKAPLITFDPNEEHVESIEDWLQAFPPSEISRLDNVGGLAVRSLINPNAEVSEVKEPQVEEDSITDISDNEPNDLQEVLANLKTCNAPITFDTLRDLAIKFKETTGFWLFQVPTGYKVDYQWRKIATNMVEGSLGRHASSASVSRESDPDCNDVVRHVISIYQPDFTNKAQVFALENEIRACGIKCKLNYKPIIYKMFGVYLKNEWGLHPTIYSSKYDVMRRSSTIEDISELVY